MNQLLQESPNLRAGILRPYGTIPIDTDLRRSIEALRQLIEALRQLQALSGAETINDPTLDDIVGLIITMQNEFGEQRSLETVIQTLVAKDIERQVAERRQAKQKASSLATTGPSSASQNRAMCIAGVL